MVLTRQQQLALSAGKKGKLPKVDKGPAKAPAESEPEAERDEEMPDTELCPRKPRAAAGTAKAKAKAKVKTTPDGKAKAKAKAKALPKSGGKKSKARENHEDGDEPTDNDGSAPAPSVPKKSRKLLSKRSKHRMVFKCKKGKKKARAVETADDDWTLYYGDDDAGEKKKGEVEEEAPPADPPARSVRARKAKRAHVEEPEAEEEENEDKEQEDETPASTFARRYCPARPLYRAKWMGIREAFQVRILPFVKFPCKLEDAPTFRLHSLQFMRVCSSCSFENCTIVEWQPLAG